MKRVSLSYVLAILVLSLGGAVPASGQPRETGSDEKEPIALDLMDLDMPGEGSGDHLELPPIQETQSPAAVSAPPPALEKPAEVKSSPAAAGKDGGGSMASPSPGIVPFLLEESAGAGKKPARAATKPAGAAPPVTSAEDLPAELKTVPPPPSHAGGLKMPSAADGKTPGESALPEIQILRAEDKEQKAPEAVGQESSLTMKPLPDVEGTAASDREARLTPAGRRQEDYLKVREDIDSSLIGIYERYYKDK